MLCAPSDWDGFNVLTSPVAAAAATSSLFHTHLGVLFDLRSGGVGALKTLVPSSSRLFFEGETKVGGDGGGEIATSSSQEDMVAAVMVFVVTMVMMI